MDFDGRISSAQNQANSSMNTYNQYAQQAGQAGDKFNNAFDNRQNYQSFLDNATGQYLNTEDMQKSRSAYQDARNAVSSLSATMNQLPDSIAGQYKSSGLMMNEAQRQRALQASYNNYDRMMNNASDVYSTASDMYDRDRNVGMQLALNAATNGYQGQQSDLGMLQQAVAMANQKALSQYGLNQTDRGLLADQYGARDQYNVQQQQLELERWKEQQANARAAADRAAQMDLQKYLSASNERIAGLNKPVAPEYTPVSTPSNNAYKGNKNVVDDGGLGGLVKQGWQNVIDYGPLALFGGGSLWR